MNRLLQIRELDAVFSVTRRQGRRREPVRPQIKPCLVVQHMQRGHVFEHSLERAPEQMRCTDQSVPLDHQQFGMRIGQRFAAETDIAVTILGRLGPDRQFDIRQLHRQRAEPRRKPLCSEGGRYR